MYIYIYTVYIIYIYTYIYIYILEIHEPLLPKPLERPGFFLWPSHSEGLAVTCSTKGSKARKPRATALPRVWAETRMDQGLESCRVYEWFMGGLWMGTRVRFELSIGRLLEAMGVPPKFQNSYARIWKKIGSFQGYFDPSLQFRLHLLQTMFQGGHGLATAHGFQTWSDSRTWQNSPFGKLNVKRLVQCHQCPTRPSAMAQHPPSGNWVIGES